MGTVGPKTNKQTNDMFEWTTVILRELAGVWGETHSHQPHNLQLSCFVYRISARTLRWSVTRGFSQSLQINAG